MFFMCTCTCICVCLYTVHWYGCVACRPLSEEEEGEGGKGGGIESSPPMEVKAEERRQIFEIRQKLSEEICRVIK